MPNDFEIHKIKDGRLIVILHPACAISKKAILALLAELGVDETAVVFLLPAEAINLGDINDAPVVMPIDKATCNDQELDAAALRCSKAGGCVIVLLGEAFSYKGLHPIAEKYGTQCGWSADQLAVCIKNPCSAPPHGSDGTPVTWPKPEQVEC